MPVSDPHPYLSMEIYSSWHKVSLRKSVFTDETHFSTRTAETGFCDAELTISDSGTTFVWPETSGGDIANFTCPLSPQAFATRTCDIGGVWQSFDETACGVVLGLLNVLNDSFSNVRKTYCKACFTQYALHAAPYMYVASSPNPVNSSTCAHVCMYTYANLNVYFQVNCLLDLMWSNEGRPDPSPFYYNQLREYLQWYYMYSFMSFLFFFFS